MDKANWQPQETTVGVKPLFYGNRDPRKITVSDLYLDGTETDTSLTGDLDDLRALMEEKDDTGSPPPLLAIWGERKERVVLENLTVDEVLFNQAGNPIRAKVALDLTQLQPDGEGTNVQVSTTTEDIF